MSLAQVCLQPHDLKGISINPGASFERNRKHMPAHPVAPDTAFFVFPLLEIHLPREVAVRPAQAFTLHVKVREKKWMKNQNDGGQAHAGHLVWKHFRASAAVAILLNVNRLTVFVPDFLN